MDSSSSPALPPPPGGRLPIWFRHPIPCGTGASHVRDILNTLHLETVCQGAQCPNRATCWHDHAAAFLILGNTCTRACRFCAIPHAAVPTALPPPDPTEPDRLARAAQQLNLHHVVVTSVTRDDLPDGGAAHFAAVIHALRRTLPGRRIEVLIPDFRGDPNALQTVLTAAPDILNHNIETVERLQTALRPQASYRCSLTLLQRAAQAGARCKSGLMLGLGETDDDLSRTLRHLREAGVTLLTMGQYLPPSSGHHPLARYVPPEEFQAWKETALQMGFEAVAAAPQVRSSYHAADLPPPP